MQHFETNRRKVSPTAIGRIPPPFLSIAETGADARKGAIDGGACPARAMLTTATMEDRKVLRIVLFREARAALRCSVRKPQQPPVEPIGNFLMQRSTIETSTHRGGVEGGSTGIRGFPSGCLSQSVASAKSVSGAIPFDVSAFAANR